MKKVLIAFFVFVISITSSYGETLYYEYGNYKGEVENGQAHGYGIFTFTTGESKGDKYVGEHLNDLRHGYGSYSFADGSKYVGQYMNDQYNGYGTFVHGSGEFKGDRYVGEFKDDRYDGQGTYMYAGGSSMSGEFKNDQPVKGTFTNGSGESKGDQFVGLFKNWLGHGQGTYTFADGSSIVGEFEDGDPLKGSYTYAAGENEGDSYVGEFKEWSFHGFGTLTRASGEKYVGEFEDNRAFNGVVYHPDGSLWGSFIDGEWCADCTLDKDKTGVVSTDSYDTSSAQLAFDQGNYAKVLELLVPYAGKADGDTQLLLAKTYLGLERFGKAVEWSHRAQAKGNIEAALVLGGSYEFGQGVNVDYEEAVKWYRIAAEAGNAFAQYSLSLMYLSGDGVKGDDSQAFKWAEKSALQGDSSGQYALGRHYVWGWGVELDYNKAFKWFNKSALQGDIDAESEIGWLYFWGNGVEKSYKQARSHWQKAADQGSAFDMDNIASLYFYGLGVEKNAVTADRWLVRAARKADEDDGLGQSIISSLENQTEDVEIKEILGAYSCYALGVYYRDGYVVEKDLDEASRWFKKSVRMGSEQAMEAFIALQPPERIKEFDYFGRYIGEVGDDLPHGIGSWMSPDQHRYYGDWMDGLKHGYGTYLWSGGSKHVGEYKNGESNGQGIWTHPEGDKYVGDYKNGEKNGQGIYTWADGKKFVGELQDGQSWDGISYLASGDVEGTWSNGKWCEGCKSASIQETTASGFFALTIGSNPSSARVYVDNSYKGETKLDIKLKPGFYQVKVEKVGYESFEQRIDLKRDMNLWAALGKMDRAGSDRASLRLQGTGTGFVVHEDYVVTADHVLEDCNAVSVRHGHKEIDSKIVARDSINDLGLIRLSQPIRDIAKLRGGKSIRKGDRVSNYGYPLYGELAESATITQGNINNLSGIGNDSRHIQLDAPSQPGNSGGPVLDSSGHVVGVISHILSKKYADKSGHIAQNVNFAVKSYLVEGFLSSNNVLFEKAESIEKYELPDIAEKAERFTVLVECWE